MSQRNVCRHYGSPQGCRFGSRCRYSHDIQPNISPLPGAATSSTSRRNPFQLLDSPTPRSPNASMLGAPRNACQFYWSTGSCNRSFECTFSHVRQPVSDNNGQDQGDNGGAAVAHQRDALNFFSPEGLAVSAGSVREQRHSFNPGEVHNHLKVFTKDNYRFEGAAQIQGFVRVLASVSDTNTSWVRPKGSEAPDFLF